MSVLLIGSGGREHALAWQLKRSRMAGNVYCAPGNGGIAQHAECVELDFSDGEAIYDFCRKKNILLVVVGPEGPLVEGLADDLTQRGLKVFGPSKAAAQLEGSKAFMKTLCDEHNIPTAKYGHFDNARDAKAYVKAQGAPIVIKADGLAAGKGVIMAQTIDEANAGIDRCFDGDFGAAGAQIIIEEWMTGEEASYFAFCDGKNIMPLMTSQDHKRAFDDDEGPNTGGMGAYGPVPVMSDAMCERTLDEIIGPTIAALKERGTPYRGVLYAGLMITKEGPKLIEYNVRFGDPECQVMMMMMKSDIMPPLMACGDGLLDRVVVTWHDGVAICVVMATTGYPGDYDSGSLIKGLGKIENDKNVRIFHAGTAQKGDDIIATGGRVLNITARGATIEEARDRAYAAIDKIDWPEGFYRKDIGWRALKAGD